MGNIDQKIREALARALPKSEGRFLALVWGNQIEGLLDDDSGPEIWDRLAEIARSNVGDVKYLAIHLLAKELVDTDEETAGEEAMKAFLANCQTFVVAAAAYHSIIKIDAMSRTPEEAAALEWLREGRK